MILLFGASGYIGRRFAQELADRQIEFCPVSRGDVDYADFEALYRLIRHTKPEFIINAAGYIGRPNVDACETHKIETIQGNLLFPDRLGHICVMLEIPWGQVSSGCVYSGYKFVNGVISGYSEEDTPNFSFASPPCSFYSGIKALAESAISGDNVYLWRIRAPFDELDCDRNYLSKLQRYDKVYDCINSLSHRGDFVKACLDLWEKRAPFGIYNISNLGYVSNAYLVNRMKAILRLDRDFEYFANDDEFYKATKAPRSSCVLNVSKLIHTGVNIRPIELAIEDALANWKCENAHSVAVGTA